MAIIEAFDFEFGAAGEVRGFAVADPEPGEVFLVLLRCFAAVFFPFRVGLDSSGCSVIVSPRNANECGIRAEYSINFAHEPTPVPGHSTSWETALR